MGRPRSVLIRLPDGTRVEVTYGKLKSRKGKSVRWFWTPDSATIEHEQSIRIALDSEV